MATAYRRKEDGKLVAQYKGADGKQHQVRLDPEECNTLRDAKRRAQELEDAAAIECSLLKGKIGKAATLASLIDWWDRNYAAKGRSFTEVRFLKKHALPELGTVKVHEVTPGMVEGFLVKKEALGPNGEPELKPKSINNLRELIGRVFNKAIEQELWRGRNPIDKVPRRKVKRKKNLAVLAPEEAKALVYALDPRWRGIVATALFLGLRKGEILGMLKEDVDLRSVELNVTRSYEYDSTKGNREDPLPIPKPLIPFLEAAIAASPNDLVFPTPDGAMYSRDTKLNLVIRRGLARAGVVIGYDHICRRTGCGYRVRQQDAEPRWCPNCQMKLWLRAIPKRTRFHDLRHTTATLLLKEGVPMGVVQKILRHSDIKVTEGIYSHLDNDDVKKGLAKMPLTGIEELAGATPGYHPGREAAEEVAADFAAKSPTEKSKGRTSEGKPSKIRPFSWSGRQDLNLRPLGPEGRHGRSRRSAMRSMDCYSRVTTAIVVERVPRMARTERTGRLTVSGAIQARGHALGVRVWEAAFGTRHRQPARSRPSPEPVEAREHGVEIERRRTGAQDRRQVTCQARLGNRAVIATGARTSASAFRTACMRATFCELRRLGVPGRTRSASSDIRKKPRSTLLRSVPPLSRRASPKCCPSAHRSRVR